MKRAVDNKILRMNYVWSKTDGICAHCGRRIKKNERTVDHFIPKSDGGSYDNRNLMPLCRGCNERRSNAIINPYKFYRYAPRFIIKECMAYKAEWRGLHRTLDGRYVI